jgi:hypothetical protein
MADETLRPIMERYSEKLPDKETLDRWANLSGKSVEEVKKLYGEVIGDPDPWGPIPPIKDDHI